jgi:ubiquitin fusion degradation protein 1
LLPPSAFDILARLQVDYPMLFRLAVGNTSRSMSSSDDGTGRSDSDVRTTHCGVLEFTAEEGCCYIPFWMMQNLLIEEGSLITVTNVSLPKATFVKLQPQSVDFLEISNPRAVLEHALRNFSCVTKDDIIQIQYNNKNYHLALKEVEPSPAACIIETDCNVDFDAPVGYVEPERVPPSSTAGTNSVRSSACPSPATTATSMTDNGGNSMSIDNNDDKKPAGTRIVNGQIVRPDEYEDYQHHAQQKTTMLAEKSGATGVQRNAAIPETAPEIDYWAIAAGDGARLDGKKPAPLKDASGTEVDIRQLRAEAAQRRAAAEEAAKNLPSSSGRTLIPSATTATAPVLSSMPSSAPPALTSKRTNRIGSKYSKLKSTGAKFTGNANNL